MRLSHIARISRSRAILQVVRFPTLTSSVTNLDEMAVILPFSFDDPETGDRITVSVSPYYSKIVVNWRTYYFIRETGEFDGVATEFKTGPILISGAE